VLAADVGPGVVGAGCRGVAAQETAVADELEPVFSGAAEGCGGEASAGRAARFKLGCAPARRRQRREGRSSVERVADHDAGLPAGVLRVDLCDERAVEIEGLVEELKLIGAVIQSGAAAVDGVRRLDRADRPG